MSIERLTAIVGARISEFKRKMAEVNAIARNAAREIRARVDADTQPLQRALARVRAQLATINGRTIWVNIRARTDRFQNEMDELASVIRTFGTVGQNMVGGGLLMLLPGLVPVIAALTGALGTVGVSIGVAAGGLLGLASSFSLAALGALALVGAMIPTIQNIKSAQTEIFEGRRALESYSKPMQRVVVGLEKMKEKWLYLNESIEPDILNAFGAMAETVTSLMEKLWPGINKVAGAFSGLMESMKNAVNNAPDMQANFGWFNERAAAAVTTWGEIAGYALRGFLNLMRAFDPLAQTTEQGLLGMTQRFSEWADGLSKSQRFNNFIEYVKENGPKLTAIFGNIIVGLVEMFAAFGPLAADMLTGFQNLTARFREWATTLSENQQFQQFIQYIRDNGPGVISLIGNLITFLVNVGIAMAPIGSFLLTMVNGFLEWSNKMMVAHPLLATIAAGLLSFFGFLRMVIPAILFLNAAFGGLIPMIGRAFMIVISYAPLVGSYLMTALGAIGRFVTMLGGWGAAIGRFFLLAIKGVGGFVGRIAFMLGEFVLILGRVLIQGLLWAGRMAAMWLVAMGPIGWVIAAVVALVALIIWQWDFVQKWSIIVWTAIWSFLQTTWSNIVSVVTGFVTNLISNIQSGFTTAVNFIQSVMQVGISFIQNAWSQIVSFVSTFIQNMISYIQNGFNNANSFINSAMSNAASFLQSAWSNIVSFVTNFLANLVSAVQNGFNQALNFIQSTMSNIQSFIQTAWSNIVNFVTNFLNNLVSAVQQGFNQALSFIQSTMSNIQSFIQTAWSNILSAIQTAVNNAYNAVVEAFNQMVSAVGEYLNQAYDNVMNIWDNITGFLEGINLFDIGANIIAGLANGIRSMAQNAIGAVTGVVGNAIDAARNLLNINSPSRVFMEMGAFTGEGFAIGMRDSIRTVARASNAMIGSAMPQLSPLEVATPASNAVYTPKVNMPKINDSGNDSKQSNQNINLTMRLGKRDYGTFVSDISQTQKEIELREQKEAGR